MLEDHAIPRPALITGLLALLPFPVLLILIWIPQSAVPADRLVPAFLSYAAVVLALLGGAHWVLAAGPYGRARITAEGQIGLGAVLASWLALISPAHFGLSLLIAAFFLLALRDALMAEASGMPPWFARLRSFVTATAIVTSILVLVRILT